MIIPIGDQPNPRGTPWVNYALIAANVLIFLFLSLPLMLRSVDLDDPAAQEYLRQLLQRYPDAGLHQLAAELRGMSAYDFLLMRWGYRPADPSPLTLLTSMFLHGGWLHLLGNMLFLWIYGDNVEHRLGRIGYLSAYLATGALAALGYGLFVPASAGNVPMVGASGAISGVLGFYFLWFPRNRVRLLVLLFPFIFTWRVSARLVLGFYLLIENLLPFLLQPAGGSGVAHGAHIGGFAAGLLGAFLVNQISGAQRRREARSLGEPGAPGTTTATSGGPESVLAAAQEGDPHEALRRYLRLLPSERRQVPGALVASLGDLLAGDGQTDAALALYQQGIADHPRGPGLDRLFLGVGLALLHGKGRPTAAYQYLMDALDAEPSSEVEQAVRTALAEIERVQKLPLQTRRRYG